MANILVLVGSTRRGGNTELLAEAFCQGIDKKNKVEIVSVADNNISPCIGCNYCLKNDRHECSQKDDMEVVYEKMKQADVLVVASPVYFYGISAKLKALIDRFHTPMRDEFTVKKCVLLLVAAATLPTVFDSIKMQYKLILDFFHLEDAGGVYVSGVKDIGDIKDNVALNQARELGARL